MSNPFEDKVFEYILAHRPLKVIFILIALLGVTKSSYEAMQPILEVSSKYLTRTFNFPPLNRNKGEIRVRNLLWEDLLGYFDV